MFIKFLALFLLFSGTAHAAYFPTFSINNFNQVGVYNSSLPTLSDGATSQLQVDVNGQLRTIDAHNDSNWATLLATLSTLNGKFGTLGQKAMSGSAPVVIASDQSAIPVTVASLPLPSGAATSALQTTGNTSLSSIDGKLGTLGQKTMAGSAPVVIASDQSALTVSAASLPLPTGASTAANQTNVQSAPGASAATAITVQGSASGVAVPVNGSVTVSGTPAMNLAQINGSTVVSATSGVQRVGIVGSTGQSMDSTAGVSNSQALTIQGNSSGIAVPVSNTAFGKTTINTTGSGTASTVSTVVTLTAPANAVGFILMNLDTSTANVRWAIGRTATNSVGQQLQPGRDTGFVPCGANVSIVAESGTQNYDVQWISQ